MFVLMCFMFALNVSAKRNKTEHIVTDVDSSRIGFVWEISGNGLKKPSWLFGSVHRGHEFTIEELRNTFSGLSEALSQAEVMGFELDPEKDKENSAELARVLQKMMSASNDMPDSLTYKDLYDSISHYEEVCSYMTDSMKTPDFEKKIPVFWTAMLDRDETSGSYNIFGNIANGDEKGVDNVVRSYARDKGYEIMGLETTAQVLEILCEKRVSLKESACKLYNQIHRMNTTTKEQRMEEYKNDSIKSADNLAKMLSLYLDQDFYNLERHTDEMSKSKAGSSLISDVMLKYRNELWLPQIMDAISDNSCLFTVGSYHLMGGDRSLISMLRAKGYTVTPVLHGK